MKNFNLENEPKIATGFSVPDGYFNDFSEKIMSQLPQQETKVISFFDRNKNWFYSVAALLVVSITTTVFYIQSNSNNSITTEDYLVYESDLSVNDFATNLTDDDLTNLENELNLYDSKTEQCINEYLY